MSKPNNKTSRAGLIIKIHVAKRDLGLDDAEYRAALLGATGKESCKELSVAEMAKVLNVFIEKFNWLPKPKAAPSKGLQNRDDYIDIPDSDPDARQKRRILALCRRLGWSFAYLNGRIRLQFGVEHIRFKMRQEDLQTLSKDIENRCKRRGINTTRPVRKDKAV